MPSLPWVTSSTSSTYCTDSRQTWGAAVEITRTSSRGRVANAAANACFTRSRSALPLYMISSGAVEIRSRYWV